MGRNILHSQLMVKAIGLFAMMPLSTTLLILMLILRLLAFVMVLLALVFVLLVAMLRLLVLIGDYDLVRMSGLALVITTIRLVDNQSMVAPEADLPMAGNNRLVVFKLVGSFLTAADTHHGDDFICSSL